MAELLNCELLLVDGRQYRVLSSSGSRYRPHPVQQQHYDDEDEEWGGGAGAGGDGGDEEADTAVDIREEGGSFVARLDLDAELYPYLIGQKGRTRQRIEQDTGAQIAFPSRSAQAGPGAASTVVVKGTSRAAVARACTQLELLISQALSARGPRSLDYNFFLCLPLANPDTSARLQRFQEAVLAQPGAAAAGLEPSVFMHPQHLHLTIAMLKLYSNERRALAQQTLHALAPRVRELLAGSPLRIQLRGLEYMNDDPSQMHVMYLGVQDAPDGPGSLQRLQQLCSTVVEAFGDAGLLLPQDERAVKLHATVINTRYRRKGSSASSDGGPEQQREQQRRQPFDGRLLLQQYADVDQGTVQLPAVHLSQRGKYDPATGFYHCADSLPLA